MTVNLVHRLAVAHAWPLTDISTTACVSHRHAPILANPLRDVALLEGFLLLLPCVRCPLPLHDCMSLLARHHCTGKICSRLAQLPIPPHAPHTIEAQTHHSMRGCKRGLPQGCCMAQRLHSDRPTAPLNALVLPQQHSRPHRDYLPEHLHLRKAQQRPLCSAGCHTVSNARRRRRWNHGCYMQRHYLAWHGLHNLAGCHLVPLAPQTHQSRLRGMSQRFCPLQQLLAMLRCPLPCHPMVLWSQE